MPHLVKIDTVVSEEKIKIKIVKGQPPHIILRTR